MEGVQLLDACSTMDLPADNATQPLDLCSTIKSVSFPTAPTSTHKDATPAREDWWLVVGAAEIHPSRFA